MRYCEKCGKELLDEAVICPHCNFNLNAVSETAPVPTIKKPQINKWWIILGAAVLLVAFIVAVLFMPRNLKMDDFKKVNVVTAIIHYGIPEAIKTNDDGEVFLRYKENVAFYGIAADGFLVHPEEDSVTFFFDDEVSYDVYKKIDRYCEFEKNISSIFHHFSYENLEITTYDYDGGYVNIEIN